MLRSWIWVPLVLAALGGVVLADPPAASSTVDEAQRTALLARIRYEPVEFEMDVGPAVSVGTEIIVETLRFPSPVKSIDPANNDTVHGKIFRTPDPAKAAVIVLGGWRRDPLTPALAMELAKTGIQTVYLQLPFQEQRKPEGAAPGQFTFSADLDQNDATFVQLAKDVQRLRDWLVAERKIDPERIGLMGTSLGGFAVATLYGMDDRFACAGVLLAGADIADAVYNGNRITSRVRAGLDKNGITRETFRDRMRLIDPGTWARKERGKGLLLLAAEHDTVSTLASVRRLAELYGGARVEVIAGVGHIAPAAVQEHFPVVAKHLATRLGVTAPKK